MSKITKDNLSDRLKDELVTDAEMLNVTGNKANLTTTDKANLVAAINELKIDFDTLRVQYEELKKVVNEGSKVVECVSIELDVENLEFTEIGKGQEIKATILPSGCTEQLVWHSSNEAVATVTNGVVVTTGVGNCTISAICGSKIDTCNVKVEEPSTSKYLLKDGKFKTTTEFGEGVFNDDDTYLDQLLERNCISLYTNTSTVSAFSYDNFIDADVINDGDVIKVTLYREVSNVDNPNLFVALFNDVYSGTSESFNSIGSSVSMYKQIASGTKKTVYTFDISSFKDHTGYLGFCYTNTVSDSAGYLYISDIEYIPAGSTSGGTSGGTKEKYVIFENGSYVNENVIGTIIAQDSDGSVTISNGNIQMRAVANNERTYYKTSKLVKIQDFSKLTISGYLNEDYSADGYMSGSLDFVGTSGNIIYSNLAIFNYGWGSIENIIDLKNKTGEGYFRLQFYNRTTSRKTPYISYMEIE
jgi:hypothetical protein